MKVNKTDHKSVYLPPLSNLFVDTYLHFRINSAIINNEFT